MRVNKTLYIIGILLSVFLAFKGYNDNILFHVVDLKNKI